MPSDDYLVGIYYLQGRDFVDAGAVSSEIKKNLKDRGIPESIIRKAAVIAFEAEINIISYADQGNIRLYVEPDAITVEAVDIGQGIADIELAQQEGYSTADDAIRELGFGAGMGLANMRKFSDVFELTSEPGNGTCIKAVVKLNGQNT